MFENVKQSKLFSEYDIAHAIEKTLSHQRTMERLSNLYYPANLQSIAENPWFNEMTEAGITTKDVKIYLVEKCLKEIKDIEYQIKIQPKTATYELRSRIKGVNQFLRRMEKYARSKD